jgi:hypothetical protein
MTKNLTCSTFHGLDRQTCSNTELTSETMKPSRYFGRTAWMGGGVLAHLKACTYIGHHNTYVHASSGIRTHDPSVRAVLDRTNLRPRDLWDLANESKV